MTRSFSVFANHVRQEDKESNAVTCSIFRDSAISTDLSMGCTGRLDRIETQNAAHFPHHCGAQWKTAIHPLHPVKWDSRFCRFSFFLRSGSGLGQLQANITDKQFLCHQPWQAPLRPCRLVMTLIRRCSHAHVTCSFSVFLQTVGAEKTKSAMPQHAA